VALGAGLEFRALLGSGRALLLAGLVVAATTVHVLVAVVLRRPVAVGLLATAALGVPSAVMSIGLAPPGAQSRAGRGDRQRSARDHRRPPPAAAYCPAAMLTRRPADS
jgi:hypothetical protein